MVRNHLETLIETRGFEIDDAEARSSGDRGGDRAKSLGGPARVSTLMRKFIGLGYLTPQQLNHRSRRGGKDVFLNSNGWWVGVAMAVGAEETRLLSVHYVRFRREI